MTEALALPLVHLACCIAEDGVLDLCENRCSSSDISPSCHGEGRTTKGGGRTKLNFEQIDLIFMKNIVCSDKVIALRRSS